MKLIILYDYTSSPFSTILLWDAWNYYRWALEIAGGGLTGTTAFHQAPLYPYFLAVIVKLTGGNLIPIYCVQIVLNSLSVSLLFVIGEKIIGRRPAIVASLVFCLYGMSTFYTFTVLTETLAVFMLLLLVMLLGTTGFRGRCVVAGILLGLMVLLKPHFLLLVPFLVLYELIRTETTLIRQRAVNILLLLAASLLAIAPATIHNYLQSEDVVLVASNGGENFYIGNNSRARGTYMVVPDFSSSIEFQGSDVSRGGAFTDGRSMTPSEASHYWFKKGFSAIQEDPFRWFTLLGWKLRLAFTGTEISNQYYLSFERKTFTGTLRLAFFNFLVILPGAVIGLLAMARHWRVWFLPYAAILSGTGAILIFFYDVRFRLPFIPFFILFSTAGLAWTWENIRKTQEPRRVRNAAAAVLLALLFTLMQAGMDTGGYDPDPVMHHFAGDAFFRLGRHDRALESYLTSLALEREHPMPYFGLCKIYFARGEKERAAILYLGASSRIDRDQKRIVEQDADLDGVRTYIQER